MNTTNIQLLVLAVVVTLLIFLISYHYLRNRKLEQDDLFSEESTEDEIVEVDFEEPIIPEKPVVEGLQNKAHDVLKELTSHSKTYVFNILRNDLNLSETYANHIIQEYIKNNNLKWSIKHRHYVKKDI